MLRELADSRLGAGLRRHRRILAAGCAGLAALLAVSVIRTPAASSAASSSPTLSSGEVAVPVTLASGAIADALFAGDVIDLVAVPRSEGQAQVVASEAEVLSVASDAGFGASSAPVVVVAVPRSTALAIADASAGHTFTAWVTSAAVRPHVSADR